MRMDLKKGLKGISLERRFRIQAISDRSLKTAELADFYLIFYLIHLIFSDIVLPAHSS